jgi:hypothetical protein
VSFPPAPRPPANMDAMSSFLLSSPGGTNQGKFFSVILLWFVITKQGKFFSVITPGDLGQMIPRAHVTVFHLSERADESLPLAMRTHSVTGNQVSKY